MLGIWLFFGTWGLGFGALNDAHRFSRSGNSAEHRQRRAALRGDENGVAPDRTAGLRTRRPPAQTRRNGLLAARRVAPLAELDDISKSIVGQREALVH